VFGSDQSLVQGATQLAYPSNDLKWEETASSNLGLDIGFFRTRLTASFDYYYRYTSDMLVLVPIQISTGSNPASVLKNYGEMKSYGMELSLNYKKSEGDFHYSITGNLTTENNEVIKLGSNNPLWSGEYENGEGYTTKTIAGGSVGDFYLYHVDGIFQSDEEADDYNNSYIDRGFIDGPQVNARGGDIRFQDVDSNGVLNNDDKLYAGSPIPDFTAGINISAEYKNIDFSMFCYGAYGNKIINGTRFWTEGMSTNYNYSSNCLNRWTPENQSTTMPRAVMRDPNGNTRPSDRWLEDGSYIRLKNIELGYSLGVKLLKKIHMNSVRLYISAQNLLTLTRYSGYDPELGGNADVTSADAISADGVKAFRDRGVDRNIYPTAKTILMGVQFNF
jgi:hypothetical protein